MFHHPALKQSGNYRNQSDFIKNANLSNLLYFWLERKFYRLECWMSVASERSKLQGFVLVLGQPSLMAVQVGKEQGGGSLPQHQQCVQLFRTGHKQMLLTKNDSKNQGKA